MHPALFLSPQRQLSLAHGVLPVSQATQNPRYRVETTAARKRSSIVYVTVHTAAEGPMQQKSRLSLTLVSKAGRGSNATGSGPYQLRCHCPVHPPPLSPGCRSPRVLFTNCVMCLAAAALLQKWRRCAFAWSFACLISKAYHHNLQHYQPWVPATWLPPHLKPPGPQRWPQATDDINKRHGNIWERRGSHTAPRYCREKGEITERTTRRRFT
ncbi:hypothetical protein SRHO_G00028930 [Serrasalmus rhombeus]